jgi:hypothetical protein
MKKSAVAVGQDDRHPRPKNRVEAQAVEAQTEVGRANSQRGQDPPTALSWVPYCKTLRPLCSQCGKTWRSGACGPTHATIWAARRAR